MYSSFKESGMKIVLFFVSFIFFNSVEISSSFTIVNVGVTSNEATICRNGQCGSSSYNYIRKVYTGLFLSHSDLALLDSMNNAALATQQAKGELQTPSYLTADDEAICCSTRVQHIANTTITNIFGVSASIVHLSDASEPSYQYIPHASCVATGSCPGKCVIEGKILTLLTLDADLQLKFDLFEIPAYCSCKGISSARISD